jgi:hypothetical protein
MRRHKKTVMSVIGSCYQVLVLGSDSSIALTWSHFGMTCWCEFFGVVSARGTATVREPNPVRPDALNMCVRVSSHAYAGGLSVSAGVLVPSMDA